MGKTIDSGDDMGGIFPKTIKDNPERLFSYLVGGLDDADGAFGCGKGFMTGQKSKTFGLFL